MIDWGVLVLDLGVMLLDLGVMYWNLLGSAGEWFEKFLEGWVLF